MCAWMGTRVGVCVLADVSLFPLCCWTERGSGGHTMCFYSCVRVSR